MPPQQPMQVQDFHPSSQRQSKSSSELSEEKKQRDLENYINNQMGFDKSEPERPVETPVGMPHQSSRQDNSYTEISSIVYQPSPNMANPFHNVS